MKIYYDWYTKKFVFRKIEFAYQGRYSTVANSGIEGIRSATYESVYDSNRVIKFTYSVESLKFMPYEKQLEEFLLSHNLRLSDIANTPIRSTIPPEEYEHIEKTLMEVIKSRYKKVKLRNREGTYAYDEAIIHSWYTKVHIVELDEWVDSSEVKTAAFQKELDKAIHYLREHDEARSFGCLLRDFL